MGIASTEAAGIKGQLEGGSDRIIPRSRRGLTVRTVKKGVTWKVCACAFLPLRMAEMCGGKGLV